MPEPVYRARHALGRSPLNTRGLRLGRWKLTRYSTGETELYDLRRDPLELRSLTRDPAYADTLAQLEALFREYRDCSGRQCLVAAATPLAARARGQRPPHPGPGAGDGEVLRELRGSRGARRFPGDEPKPPLCTPRVVCREAGRVDHLGDRDWRPAR